MAHITTTFTRNIEIDATREDSQDGLEVTTTDGGGELRNSRSEFEPRRYEIAGYHGTADNEDYLSMRQMWRDTERGLHTFDFYDWLDEELVKVRFSSPMRISSPAGHLVHIDTFNLKECNE